jgi:uncharacterized protein (TIGR02117 family)
MGVPGEIADGRKLKRPRATVCAILLASLLAYLYVPIPAPRVPPPTADDCTIIRLWSNGYHSDLGVPAEVLPEHHPLRRLYPDATEFLIGWGDQAFYYSDGTNLWLGLDALIPPSPSVMHVAYNAPAASAYLGPNDDLSMAISREGARRFVAYLDRALILDAQGDVIPTSTGKVVGRSAFLRTRGSFHLFNVCNQWMARALRSAGVNINARAAWLAGPLIRQARTVAPSECSPSQPT